MITLFLASGDSAQIEAGTSVQRDSSLGPNAVELVCRDVDGTEVGRFKDRDVTGYSISGSVATNKLVVQRLIDGVVNRKRLSEVMELFAPDFHDHVPTPGRKEGLEGVRETYAMLHGAFPQAHFSIDALIAEGDKVAVLLSTTTKHEGPLYGIPATGRQVTISSLDIYRIGNGLIVEHWGYGNDLGLAQQLGIYRHLLPDEERVRLPDLADDEPSIDAPVRIGPNGLEELSPQHRRRVNGAAPS